jgi:hypothetical protein
MNGVDETQLLDYRKSVGGIRVHVVAVRGLGRPAMAAAMVRDHAISLSEEEHNLAVPVVGDQRPAMMEEQRLASFGRLTLFCLSSGNLGDVDFSAALSDEREDLSGEITLQGSNGVEFQMPFRDSTSNIVLGSLIGS